MKGYILLGLLCTLTVQQTVLFSSSNTNTIITSPPGVNVAISNFHEDIAKYANFEYDAKWIYKAGPQSWPDGDTATFAAQFYTDCQSPATLIAWADNQYSVNLNGVTYGNIYHTKAYIPINPKCGLNNLVIVVTNRDRNSPAGIVFAVSQDQTKCYTCLGSLSFYNRDTCTCECTEAFKCAPTSSLYSWRPYPVCGYTCSATPNCSNDHYWNTKTCSCKCKTVLCPTNQIQHSKTCKCKEKCMPTRNCNPGEIWDFDDCKCVKLQANP